jgi:peptidoglycan hydrolase CwlO-like protein
MERIHAISVQELVDSHREALEQVKARCESKVEAAKKACAEDRAALEEKLRTSEKNGRNLTKIRNGLVVALAMAEDDVAGFKEEVVELEESNGALKDALGEKYAEGFSAALEQVKVLFPDLDEATLSEVDILKLVEGGKLVSRLPLPEDVPKEATVGESQDSEGVA